MEALWKGPFLDVQVPLWICSLVLSWVRTSEERLSNGYQGNGKPNNARSSEGDSIKMQYLSYNFQQTTFPPLFITYFYSLRS